MSVSSDVSRTTFGNYTVYDSQSSLPECFDHVNYTRKMPAIIRIQSIYRGIMVRRYTKVLMAARQQCVTI